jgi:hypothetical protein
MLPLPRLAQLLNNASTGQVESESCHSLSSLISKDKTLGANVAYRAVRPNVHTRHWGRESDKRDKTNVYKSVELHVIH